MEHFEKTKLVKYCEEPGCLEPLKAYQMIDEVKSEHMMKTLWYSYQKLKDAVKFCNHGKFEPEPPYNVVGVDTFSNDGDCKLGTYKTLEEAKHCADKKGGNMFKTHVYDKNGRHVYEAGTF